MEIQPRKPTTKGSSEMFTGDVWIDPIFSGQAPSRINVGAVHFTPGARSAWHSHSLGQTLYVIEGEGRVQSRGEPIATIHSGDVIYTPADEWHWHGASPQHLMTHISMTEGGASWGDHVTDEEYNS